MHAALCFYGARNGRDGLEIVLVVSQPAAVVNMWCRRRKRKREKAPPSPALSMARALLFLRLAALCGDTQAITSWKNGFGFSGVQEQELNTDEEEPDMYFRSPGSSNDTPFKAMACVSHCLDIFPVFPTAVVVGAGAVAVVPCEKSGGVVEAVRDMGRLEFCVSGKRVLAYVCISPRKRGRG